VHRTNNMLAMIQAIVSNTLVRGRDIAEAKRAILGRLHALARAQQFVAAGPAAGVPLRDLVEAELGAYRTRATIEGPHLVMGGEFAQMFALVLHELASNAAKHGALSAPEGRLSVRWEVRQQEPNPEFSFTWAETGGRSDAAPAEPRFGSKLIATGLGGSPRISSEPGRYGFEIVLPLSAVMKPSRPPRRDAPSAESGTVDDDAVRAEVRRSRDG
jgi:two-component sensor histidine kinase